MMSVRKLWSFFWQMATLGLKLYSWPLLMPSNILLSNTVKKNSADKSQLQPSIKALLIRFTYRAYLIQAGARPTVTYLWP